MSVDNNTPITLTVSLEAVNVILGSLGAQPYDRVVGLITNLQQQAAAQLQALQEAPKAADE